MKVDKTSRMALQNLEIRNALEIIPNCKDGTTSTMFFLRLECIPWASTTIKIMVDPIDISFIFRYSNRRHPISLLVCDIPTRQRWEFPKNVHTADLWVRDLRALQKAVRVVPITYSNSSSCTLVSTGPSLCLTEAKKRRVKAVGKIQGWWFKDGGIIYVYIYSF